MATMTVSEAILSRHSCRQFIPDKQVEESLVKEMLAKASRAASDGNIQPWKCYVVSGAARSSLVEKVQTASAANPMGNSSYHNYPDQPAKSAITWDLEKLRTAEASDGTNNVEDWSDERLAAERSNFRKTAGSQRRKRCGEQLYQAIKVDKKDTAGKLKQLANNLNFFGAPTAVIVTVDRVFDRPQWGSVGMFLQSLALLCEEQGLSSCFQGYFGLFGDAIKQPDCLGKWIPQREIVWCGMGIGYKDEAHPINSYRTERMPVEEFATFITAKL